MMEQAHIRQPTPHPHLADTDAGSSAPSHTMERHATHNPRCALSKMEQAHKRKPSQSSPQSVLLSSLCRREIDQDQLPPVLVGSRGLRQCRRVPQDRGTQRPIRRLQHSSHRTEGGKPPSPLTGEGVVTSLSHLLSYPPDVWQRGRGRGLNRDAARGEGDRKGDDGGT
jgi:hypothetical protein